MPGNILKFYTQLMKTLKRPCKLPYFHLIDEKTELEVEQIAQSLSGQDQELSLHFEGLMSPL